MRGEEERGEGREGAHEEGGEGAEGKRYNWHHQSVNKDLIMSEMRWLSNRFGSTTHIMEYSRACKRAGRLSGAGVRPHKDAAE